MPRQQKPTRVEQPEIIWIGENRGFLEENYPGKWIAVKGRELIAVGDTRSEVRDKANLKGVSNALITGVRKAEYRGIKIIPAAKAVTPKS